MDSHRIFESLPYLPYRFCGYIYYSAFDCLLEQPRLLPQDLDRKFHPKPKLKFSGRPSSAKMHRRLLSSEKGKAVELATAQLLVWEGFRFLGPTLQLVMEARSTLSPSLVELPTPPFKKYGPSYLSSQSIGKLIYCRWVRTSVWACFMSSLSWSQTFSRCSKNTRITMPVGW